MDMYEAWSAASMEERSALLERICREGTVPPGWTLRIEGVGTSAECWGGPDYGEDLRTLARSIADWKLQRPQPQRQASLEAEPDSDGVVRPMGARE